MQVVSYTTCTLTKRNKQMKNNTNDVQAIIRRLWNAGMTLDQIINDQRIVRTNTPYDIIAHYYVAIQDKVGCGCLNFSQLQNGLNGKIIRPIPFEYMKAQ